VKVADIIRFKKTGYAATVTHIRYGAISDDTVVTLLVHANTLLFPGNTTDFTLRHLRDTAEVISEADGVDCGTGIIVGTCEDMSHPPPKNPETTWRVLFPKSKGKNIGHIRSNQLEVVSEA